MIRSVTPADHSALIEIADSTGIFPPDEASALLGGVLEELHAGRLGEGHQAHVWADLSTGEPAGWVYFAPTAHADGVWDLWWIGVDPTRQKQGIGSELLGFVEQTVRADSGRLLLIETSALAALDATRRFYRSQGYTECGLVPDFYADGDGKVIFVKRLTASASTNSVTNSGDW